MIGPAAYANICAVHTPLPSFLMRAVVSLLVIVVLLAACGYKGPLYLPKPKPEAQQPAPAAAQPTKKDDSSSQ